MAMELAFVKFMEVCMLQSPEVMRLFHADCKLSTTTASFAHPYLLAKHKKDVIASAKMGLQHLKVSPPHASIAAQGCHAAREAQRDCTVQTLARLCNLPFGSMWLCNAMHDLSICLSW